MINGEEAPNLRHGRGSVECLRVDGSEEGEEQDDDGQGKHFQANALAVLKRAGNEFHHGFAQQEDADHRAKEHPDAEGSGIGGRVEESGEVIPGVHPAEEAPHENEQDRWIHGLAGRWFMAPVVTELWC
jgi:hypothetical protein